MSSLIAPDRQRARAIPLVLLLAAIPAFAEGPVLQAVYIDPPGFGFNDNTPVAPVPGNPHTSRGAQRRAVMSAALDVWATQIDSRVPIRVQASFADLGCGIGSNVGVGGPTYAAANFPNAPEANVNYPGALATHLAGHRLSPMPEIEVVFNARVDDDPACMAPVLPGGFWYGLGKPQPRDSQSTPFFALAVHEVGHGLGYSADTFLATGVFPGNPPRPSAYAKRLYSVSMARHWHQMTPAERVASAASEPDLVWSGTRANQLAAEHLLPPAQIRVEPAVDQQGRFPALVHGLRLFPRREGLRARFVIANNAIDIAGSGERADTDACQPLTNAEQSAGSIVLATRGSCSFDIKWRHAHAAGAVALVLADNVAPGAASALVRNRQLLLLEALPIPYWSVSQPVGLALIAEPPQWITLAYDETQPPIGTNDGKLIIAAVANGRPGSNVSHLSDGLMPPSVMGSGLGVFSIEGLPELAPGVLHDLGWPDMSAKHGHVTGNWYDPERSGEGCQLTLEGDDRTWILTCYTHLAGEQVWLLGTAQRRGDRLDFDDVHFTRGADYGAGFDPDDVERIAWGRIRMQLLDCNQALFVFSPTAEAYARRQLFKRKIVNSNCQRTASDQPDRRLSGNWYDPARSGEGIQIAQEGDGSIVVLTFYTYVEGRQLWLIGTGAPAGNIIVFADMHLTRGGDYGSGFDPGAIERIPFGTITLEPLDCNHAKLTIEPTLAPFEPAERVVTRIVPRICR